MTYFRRPVRGHGRLHAHPRLPDHPGRPLRQCVPVSQRALTTMTGPAFKGMDPSDPSTYVRAWNPAPGMIGYLNWDGSQAQGSTEMGGLWGLPARFDAQAASRPARVLR